jgi:cytosine/adenosine deaminase-related metal-dependent hydrolase
VAIKDGKVAEIGQNLAATGATEIDATGKVVAPACASHHHHHAIAFSPSSADGITRRSQGWTSTRTSMPRSRTIRLPTQ